MTVIIILHCKSGRNGNLRAVHTRNHFFQLQPLNCQKAFTKSHKKLLILEFNNTQIHQFQSMLHPHFLQTITHTVFL